MSREARCARQLSHSMGAGHALDDNHRRANYREALVCAILTCLVLSPAAMHATNPQFTAIYVFGDSYCDVGNLSLATGGEFPGPLYYNGRFSNGPVWTEHVASAWGLPMKPSLLNGTDYAWAGPLSQRISPFGGEAVIPSTPHQVALYLSQHGGKADPNALYILEGGGNDIIDATGGSPRQLGLQIAIGTANNEPLRLRFSRSEADRGESPA
jgi:phospholipase/lecithinase/hemolysin